MASVPSDTLYGGAGFAVGGAGRVGAGEGCGGGGGCFVPWCALRSVVGA